jgi:hypothetical protein
MIKPYLNFICREYFPKILNMEYVSIHISMYVHEMVVMYRLELVIRLGYGKLNLFIELLVRNQV